ncbi:flagellar export chaperone FliS [Thiovibrio sp. JS02]
MVGQQVVSAYRKTEKHAEIHPVRLIHMLYERVLMHLEQAEVGIRENNPRKRGENLSKAIAIVTELSASVKSEDESEAAQFLRGLYGAILMELPKASMAGEENVKILRQSYNYLKRLKDIWEDTAMREEGLGVAAQMGREREGHGVSAPQVAMAGGLSVSI